MKKSKSTIIYTMIILLVFIAAGLLWMYMQNTKKVEKIEEQKQVIQESEAIEEEDDESDPEEGYPEVTYGGMTLNPHENPAIASSASFMASKIEKYPEMVAWMLWDTGIVQEEVMQKDMDYYVGHAANTGTTPKGQPFLDPSSDYASDRIVTVYSYGIGGEGRLGYLSDLGNQDIYDKNQTFLMFYKDYLDWYQVDAVFNLKSAPGFDYNKKDFKDKNDFETWYTIAKNASTIDSGLTATRKNHFIVLVVQTSQDEKTILIAKRLKRYPYSDYQK